ncbi:MAG TPA: pyruvate dehydrogenase (acetyl-transferring), homodimeric type, partial [Terriglobales bacterium]
MATVTLNGTPATRTSPDANELREWLEAFQQIVDQEGPAQASEFLAALQHHAQAVGVQVPASTHTPYLNTIPVYEEVQYPGDRNLERRLEALIRWNAMAMVHHQNKRDAGIGGHIATYSSLATLLEVGFNHFWHAHYGNEPGDLIFFQGHASPGVYARAFLEGRLTEKHLDNFRHELRGEPGLPSYPHPWLMPDFWKFPTVSMGIGPINSIYQARFMRYAEHRKLIAETPRKVWAFLGDGEMDEPESLGAIRIASGEKLDNLIWVVNCNLQRLDGPVRGNAKVINELEGVFRGAGWNVIKVIWGHDWDELLDRDQNGLLLKRMEEVVDGEWQAYAAKGGAYFREHFWAKYPELLALVQHMSDDELIRLHRGGHDPAKIYNAYKRAVENTGTPTVILAKTIKGYGLGSAEARNATHQEKKLSEDSLVVFRNRFGIEVPDEAAKDGLPFKPAEDSPELRYMRDRREALGGFVPHREVPAKNFDAPDTKFFNEFLLGSKGRELSTTMGFVSILRSLLKHPEVGKLVVPIVPDEGRTFGLESAVRQVGIYASQGQLYTPHDQDILLYYREEKDGQILEEGITEAGAMASFTAAGTAYYNYNLPAVPFYMYYSMFGFQRIGDLVWAFADARGKGFLMGGTAGRTTLMGEGLQHQDGHSPLLFSVVPTCINYDPAYVYELAVIVQDGLRRMYQNGEDCFYYITMYNEDYAQPEMPKGVEEGILRGMYKYKAAPQGPATIQLFGSGPMLNEALQAQSILAEKHGVQADVWSVTSYTELRRDALATDRYNRLHPAEKEKVPYLITALKGAEGPIIASSDYMKAVPDQIAPWLPGRLVSLGTDGFGRSDNREYLRKHFEVNA